MNLYDLIYNYNFTLLECFVNEYKDVVLWRSGQSPSGINSFDIVLVYDDPGLINYFSIDYVLYDKVDIIKGGSHCFIFKKKI